MNRSVGRSGGQSGTSHQPHHPGPSINDLTTKEFKQSVLQRIKECMLDHDNTPLFEKDFEIVDGKLQHMTPLTIQEVLGEQDSGPGSHWWRLYINPMDWEKALKHSKDNPGSYYDTDESPGYQAAMIEAYRKYLADEKPLATYFRGNSAKTFDWKVYQELWEVAFDPKNPEPCDKGASSRLMRSTDVSFATSAEVASDIEKAQVSNMILVATPTIENAWVRHKITNRGLSEFITNSSKEQLMPAVKDVFHDFKHRMSQSYTRKQQLVKIAEVVRYLHVLHMFTDGCGRVNIFLILPALLLRWGFGLPFGGQSYGKIKREALFILFNGGFSLLEIAEFLWVSQDFGLKARERGLTSAIDQLPADGTTHAPTSRNKNEHNAEHTTAPSHAKTTHEAPPGQAREHTSTISPEKTKKPLPIHSGPPDHKESPSTPKRLTPDKPTDPQHSKPAKSPDPKRPKSGVTSTTTAAHSK